jgi:hypothetical protein
LQAAAQAKITGKEKAKIKNLKINFISNSIKSFVTLYGIELADLLYRGGEILLIFSFVLNGFNQLNFQPVSL